MKKLIALAAAIATFTAPAFASKRDRSAETDRPAHSRESSLERHGCSTKPASEWLPVTQITTKLQAQGFSIQKIEAKSGCYEARVIDANGASIELHLDSGTAEIIRRRERR